MTQQEVMNHPFWGKVQQRVGVVINGLMQRGQLNPNESQLFVQLLKQSYPALHNFIERLNMNYQEITDQQMDMEIYNMLVQGGAINQVKARMAQMTGGFGVGFGTGGGAWGGGGGFGGGRPVGFGFDPGFGGARGIPTSPFGGGGGQRSPSVGTFEAPPSSPASLFGGGGQPTKRENAVKQALKPDVKSPVAPPQWKAPEVVDEKSYDLVGVAAQITRFNLSTGESARRVIVYDPKVGYTSDHEVLEKYKSVFDLFPDSRRKFITIAYQQLKIVRVGRDEFLKMATALSIAVNKAANVEAKLRAIIATLRPFSVDAYSEFSRLFLDELEMHIQCGELCDSAHPKNILNRPNKIEDVLAWITGDINKDMLAAMRGMDGFEVRLEALLNVMIETLVASLPKIILDTNSDMTTLDDFYRALPGIWTTDCGTTFSNCEDLVNVFLATRETIEGSKTANASKSESVLKTKLTELSKHFTMIFLPRVISWCNYSKADVCRYDEKGNCQPACFSKLQPRNDVEFFVEDTLEKWDTSRDTKYKWAPKNLLLQIDEETYTFQYGRTTDGQGWCGTAIYWH